MPSSIPGTELSNEEVIVVFFFLGLNIKHFFPNIYLSMVFT